MSVRVVESSHRVFSSPASHFQFYYLAGYYQALLLTGMILLTMVEVVRLYLGYIGNLEERVIRADTLSEAQLAVSLTGPMQVCSTTLSGQKAAALALLATADCSIGASPHLTDPLCPPLLLSSSPPSTSCHQVPELAAFWVLSFMFQLPVLLFFLTDEKIIILPLERAVHSIYLFFLLAQILASFLALRTMTRKLTLLFHLRQFGNMDSLRQTRRSPVYGLHYHRGTLPVTPIHSVCQ